MYNDNNLQQPGDKNTEDAPETPQEEEVVKSVPQKEQSKGEPDKSQILNPSSSSSQTDVAPIQDVDTTKKAPEAVEKKKEDEKLGIYKALAIKLKKELVKTRDELQKFREESQKENSTLTNKVKILDELLNSERINSATTIATLEASVKSLKSQLEASENDLNSIQTEFENYKVRASQIMQQNHSLQSNSVKTFEEERYKQLKTLNDAQRNRITGLESQLTNILERNREFEKETKILQEQLELARNETKSFKELEDKCANLSRENENLKFALKQYSEKLKDPNSPSKNHQAEIESLNNTVEHVESPALNRATTPVDPLNDVTDVTTQVSPSTSVKDDCQTNSSSSYDDSTSGYVHIKPTTFEIISRTSLLEDAQNQIDNLTKAYLDSESTNSLLSEQVRALKEEIRRIQRGTERMDLADNLEYLKNVVFKFLSLDSNQSEQRQRLVPVLSTVLKLSPDETAKLSSLAMQEKSSMASSLFKLGGG